MSSTNDKILESALHLFNTRGVDQVKMRDIAKKLGISLGNVTYHFPTKIDLIHVLCLQFVNKVDEVLAEAMKTTPKSTLLSYFHQVEIIFNTQLEYKFIFNKRYGEILSSLPEMQKHYQEVQIGRHKFWKQLNEQLVKEKLAKPSLVDDSYGHNYILNMLALFWHQEIAIYLPRLTDKQKVDHALAIFFQAYKPYLTQKGLDELAPSLKKLGLYSNIK